MRFRVLASALPLLLVPALASANVSLKNGNFFIGYTDIVYQGGFEPKIERVYNSKTPYRGIFGAGWGNEYEVYLRVVGDGSVVVHEYGGGAENRFSPVKFDGAELGKAIDAIADAARKDVGGGPAGLESYKKRLRAEAVYRSDEWDRLYKLGRVKPRDLANGTQLVSNRFSFQYITKVADGYVRVFDNGRIEKFAGSGKLVRISDKNANFIELTYGKDGKLQKIVDNFNRKIFFTFNVKGLVDKIEGENGKVATYKYNADLELVYSKDVDANVYTYKYDPEKYHNLVEIGYADKTTMQMAYHPRDLNLNIKSVKDRDGTLTEYGYVYGKDKGKYAITVKVKGADKREISSSKYEYETKTKADGEEWTYRLAQTVDGDKTETTYNECCGLPLVIKRNAEETLFEYDAKGHVTKKTTPTEITRLEYDPKVSKVTKVSRFSKMNPKSVSWSEFKYDEKGNLTFAKNSENKGVRLFYDTNGRIKTMVDQSKRKIEFKYNEASKPVEISDPALGTITVQYTNSGEIKKVESTAGRKIALQVTSAFQNLLEIIRPAGVSLSF